MNRFQHICVHSSSLGTRPAVNIMHKRRRVRRNKGASSGLVLFPVFPAQRTFTGCEELGFCRALPQRMGPERILGRLEEFLQGGVSQIRRKILSKRPTRNERSRSK